MEVNHEKPEPYPINPEYPIIYGLGSALQILRSATEQLSFKKQ
jgi:hypothetical protein